MTSSIINFIVDRYLSDIVEIDPQQTVSKLLSGTFEMGSLKIKNEIFDTMNLPYFELVDGYIGKLTIKIQFPRFYAAPIQVIVEKVFFHARQKRLDKLDKEKEIAGMELYKKTQLKKAEEFISELNKFKQSENSPGMVSQIINNVQISVKDICIRFDDEISCPEIPFSFGIVMKELKIRTTNDSFEFNEEMNENIPYGEVNHKIIQIKDLNVYLDTLKNKSELDFRYQIVDNEETSIEPALENILKEKRDFYKYCLSETNVHLQDSSAHQYLLFKMGLTLKTSLNDNLNNGNPKASAECHLEDVQLSISVEQIFVLLKLLAYINLNSYYRIGISQSYYVRKLTKDEQLDYMNNYMTYYKSKYNEKAKNLNEANLLQEHSLDPFEVGLTYDQIQTMREAALMKLERDNEKDSIDNQINAIKNSGSYWNPMSYFKGGPTKEEQEKIDLLMKQKEELENNDEDANKKIEEHLNKQQGNEIDYLRDIADEFVLYHVNFFMPNCKMSIMENKTKSMVDIEYKDFEVVGDLKKKGQFFSLFIENIKVSQKKLLDSPYQSLLETIEDEVVDAQEDPNIKRGATYIEFENNPSLEKSNYRLKFRNTKQMILTLNLYSIQYISNRVLASLKSTINFNDIQKYAVGEVNKYIKAGFVNNVLSGNYQHFNIDLDIKIKSPILLLPQNVCDVTNRNCMLLRFGDLEMRSELPPRQNFKDIDYMKLTDRKQMYDVYIMEGKNFYLATLFDFDGDIKHLAQAKKLNLIDDVCLVYSMANLIEPKNEYLENLIMKIQIQKIKWNLRDTQLVYMINFLDGFTRVNYQLAEDLKEVEREEKESVENKKEEEKKEEEKKEEEKKEEEKKEEEKKEEDEEINTDKKPEEKKEEKKEEEKKEEEKKEEKKEEEKKEEEKKEEPKKLNNKVFFLLEFVLSGVEFNIQKSLSLSERNVLSKISDEDLHGKEFKEYLVFKMDRFEFDLSMTNNANMKVGLLIDSICINDKEVKYTEASPRGELIVNAEFQKILETISGKNENVLEENEVIDFYAPSNYEKTKTPFIGIEYVYNSLNKLTEINMTMQKMILIFNYTSLANLYQFYQYYLNKMFTTQMKTNEQLTALKKEKSDSLIIANSLKTKENSLKLNNKKFLLGIVSKITEKISTETRKEKNKMNITFAMKEIEMKIPLEALCNKTKVVRFNFNFVTKISMKNEYESIISTIDNKLIKCNYSVKDMNMSAMFFNIDFDIIDYADGKFVDFVMVGRDRQRVKQKEKILSNFRIEMNIDSFILVEDQKNVMVIELKMEPMSIIIGFREYKATMKFLAASMKLLTDMYLPYDDPIKTFEEEVKVEAIPEAPGDELAHADTQKRLEEYKKGQNEELTKKKEEKKKKEDEKNKSIYNISNFNSQMDVLFQMDKVSMKFLDNTGSTIIPLLNIESNKISFKYVSNSDPNDVDNISNVIVESVSRKDIPITDYNVMNLYQYLDGNFNLEVNFFNYRTGDWEPIMEPWIGNLKVNQVATFTCMKAEFKSEDILNINLSIDSVRVFNSVMKKLSQDEKDWEIADEHRGSSLYSFKGSDIAVEFLNRTGIDVQFWLDADKKVKTLPAKRGKKQFTYNMLGDAYRKLNDINSMKLKKDKFSFVIGNSCQVEGHDFSYNHPTSYLIAMGEHKNVPVEEVPSERSVEVGMIEKEEFEINTEMKKNPEDEVLRINDIHVDDKSEYIGVSVRVKQNGTCQEIVFSSNVSFYNNMKYPIELSFISEEDFTTTYNSDEIQVRHRLDKKDKRDFVIKEGRRMPIPVKYIIKPHRIYAAYQNENGTLETKFTLIYENLNFLKTHLVDLIRYDESISSSEGNEKAVIEDFASKMIKISDPLTDNFIHSSVDLMVQRGISEKVRKEDNPYVKSEGDNVSPKTVLKTYNYVFLLNQPLIIENQVPYPLSFDLKEGEKVKNYSMSPLSLSSLYDISLTDKQNTVVFKMKYHDVEYNSEPTPLVDIISGANSKQKDKLGQKVTEVKFFEASSPDNFFILKIKIEENDSVANLYDTSVFRLIKHFSKKKHLIFYFDYIIVNKTSHTLFAVESGNTKNFDENKTNGKFLPEEVSLFSFSKDKIQIKNEVSAWSKAFSATTFGMSGVISLEEEGKTSNFNKKGKDTIVTEIAAVISSSSKFQNSIIIKLEQRFLIYNCLNVPISYRQYDTKKLESNQFFNFVNIDENTHHSLSFVKNDKKIRKYLQLSVDHEFYSAPFQIENIQDFNIKIPIKDKAIIESLQNSDKNHHLFEINGIMNLFIKITIYSRDNGLIYIVLHNPKFTEYGIRNLTKVPVTIMQKKAKGEEERITIVPNQTIPYVWSDFLQDEKLLIVHFEKEGEADNKESEVLIDFSSIEVVKFNNYQLQVILENRNSTRTLVIKEITAAVQKKNILFKILKGEQKTTNIKYYVDMKGLGLSIIDQEPKEVFYISFYGINLKYLNYSFHKGKVYDSTNHIILLLKNFQIDYCLEDSFKSILVPKDQFIPSNEEERLKANEDIVPFLQILLAQHTVLNKETDLSTTNIPQFDFTMQEINVNVDQFSCLTLLSLQSQLLGELDFYYATNKEEKKDDNQIKNPAFYDKNLSPEVKDVADIIEQSENSNMIFINFLFLSAMKINLTLRIDISAFDISVLPGILVKIIASLGNSLARISDSPLRLSEMIHQNVFTDINRMIGLLMSHYTRQGMLEIYKLLGSSDLLGNPVGLVDKLGTGFFEFFNEPRKGFLKGPVGFGEGIAKGVGSLVGNIVAGSADVVGKITGTLLSAAKTIQGEKINIREDDEPDNIFIGIYDGIKGGGIELGKGIAGIFTNPYKSAKQEGVKGFFKGIGTGLIGVVVSPFAAALRMGNAVFVGIKNTAGYLKGKKIKTTRFRHPRKIEKVTALKPYDEDSAEIWALLKQFEYEDRKIVYFKEFNYYDVGYSSEKESILILTDKEILVFYDVKEIAFNLPVNLVKNVEVHIEGEYYLILFNLVKDSKKYIQTKNIIMCTELYSILEKNFVDEKEEKL